MKIKSGIITQGSGSVGGLTLSRGRSGMYLRGRAMPVDPASAAQVAVRNLMSQLTAAWASSLSQAYREAWETYAANVTLTDRLGDQINITGMNMYVRSNVSRLQAGLTRVDVAPVVYDLGTFTPPVVTASQATQQLSVAFTDTDAWVDEDDAGLLVYASRQKGPARNYFKGPYIFVDSIDGDSVTAPTTPQTFSTPFAIDEDNKQFYAIRVARADGRLSSLLRLSTTIAA